MSSRPIASAFLVLSLLPTAASRADPLAYPGGDLRVDVRCADGFATPDHGLQVTVDGIPVEAVGTNGYSMVSYSDQGPVWSWEPTDVGYEVAPGPHHLVIAAPGCAPDERDVNLSGLVPALVTGRLAISDPALEGPVGAPNGLGITFGAYSATKPAESGSNSLFGTSYDVTAAPIQGGWLGVSYEHRGFVLGWDLAVGGGTLTGAARAGASYFEGPRGPFPFSETVVQLATAVRLGVRLPLHDVALEAGSGLGGDLWLTSGSDGATTPPNVLVGGTPGPVDPDWFVPLWAGLTIKRSCNWGAQVIASYDVRPTALDASALTLAAGLMYQPSDACEQPPGVRVR